MSFRWLTYTQYSKIFGRRGSFHFLIEPTGDFLGLVGPAADISVVLARATDVLPAFAGRARVRNGVNNMAGKQKKKHLASPVFF